MSDGTKLVHLGTIFGFDADSIWPFRLSLWACAALDGDREAGNLFVLNSFARRLAGVDSVAVHLAGWTSLDSTLGDLQKKETQEFSRDSNNFLYLRRRCTGQPVERREGLSLD